MHRLRLTAAGAAAAVVAWCGAQAPLAPTAAAAGSPSGAAGARGSQAACPAPAVGTMSCLARVATIGGRRVSVAGTRRPAVAPATAGSCATVGGYGPAQIQNAYNVVAAAASTGTTQTVAIIDAYDNPNAAADLANYRSCWGLPACTAASGCFTKVDQAGGTAFIPAGRVSGQLGYGWGLEIALDLDAVSSACPNCHILLVEANSGNDSDLAAAVQESVRLGATQLSMSFGGCEGAPDQSQFDAVLNATARPITVASGDNGYLAADNPVQQDPHTACPVDGAPSYPASSPYVTAAGGTSLVPSATPRGWTETAWSYSNGIGAGSGCSADEAKPAWQHDVGCPRRTVTDVAADADPNTGLATYDTWDDSGWGIVGGTSLSAPLIAGIQSLGAGAPGSPGAQRWYAANASLYDVTTGSNAPSGASDCAPAMYLCSATAGYDGPTGLGSPNGVSIPTGATISPPLNEFGVTGRTETLTVTNGSSQPAVIAGTSLSGPNAGSFTLSNPPAASGQPPGCQGATVAAGQSCLLAATYTGTASGPATVTVDDGEVRPPTAALVADGAAVSTLQYGLAGSDGSTWTVIDAAALTVSITPGGAGSLVFSGNADLWTQATGYNQDLGICVTIGAAPTQTCPASEVASWKESGGFGGTFSPNAAFVEHVLANATTGTTYEATLVWKTNVVAPGSAVIHAGAGPLAGQFSPTRLAVRWYPAGTVQATSITSQPQLANQPASAWQVMDPNGLHLQLTGSQASTALLTANADLWTATAGYNQDIGICVTATTTCDSAQVLAWKEAGGFAGTFSPNAAFVQTTLALNAGQIYQVYVVWKPNRSGSDLIVTGAGSSTTGFSPTWLTATIVATPSGAVSAAVSPATAQYTLSDAPALQWVPMAGVLTLDVSTASTCLLTVGANADLWTRSAGVNQDLAILVTPAGTTAAAVAGWKESGGFAGTFSPNAAALQVSLLTTPGVTYHLQIAWKANRLLLGSGIFAGAGSANAYSPTGLVAEGTASLCW